MDRLVLQFNYILSRIASLFAVSGQCGQIICLINAALLGSVV